MNERLRIQFAYLAVTLIWGSTWLVIKIGLTMIPPLIGAALRFVVATIVLFGLARFWRVNVPWHRRARIVYAVVALFSFSVPFAMVYWGQQYVSSGLASILFGTYPFFVALFASFLLQSERLTVWKMSGIIIGFAGIVIIFSNDLQFSGGAAFWGMAAIVGSALLQAFSVIILKKYAEDIDSVAITMIPMAISGFLLLVVSLSLETVTLSMFTWQSLLSIGYLGIFGSVVTFVNYFWLLKRMDAVYLALLAFVTPIIAVILGILLLGEAFDSRIYIGAALVLCGIATAHFGGYTIARSHSAEK